MNELSNFLKQIDKSVTIIKKITSSDEVLNHKNFATINLFIPAYRMYEKWPNSFLHKDIETILKERFDLDGKDVKSKNLLKVKTDRFLNKLIEIGYISKTKSKTDKRVSIFTFTPSAIKAFEKYKVEFNK